MEDILLAEDDEHLRRSLARGAKFRGFTVREFSSGEDLLDALEEERPRFVITDYDMGEGVITGLELADEIRAKQHLDEVEIIMYSTEPDLPDFAEQIRKLRVTWFSKPVPTPLWEHIEKLTE